MTKNQETEMRTPRENLKLLGHEDAQKDFLKTFHSERFSHSWILTGPFGIGKATFAFSMACYILSGRQDGNISFSEDDPLYRRIVAQSHGDLLTLGNEENQEISIDSVRELNQCLNQTSAEGGWRVVLIDGAENLNRNAANALLKRLEEPPSRTVFFLITSQAGHLLPTIRSRCQFLTLKPLSEETTLEVLKSQNFSVPDFLSIAQGSPGRLMRLMDGKGQQIYTDLQKIIKGDSAASFIHKCGGDEGSYGIVEDLLRNFLHTQLLAKVETKPSIFDQASLDQTMSVYGKIEDLFDQCNNAQLDRKTTLTCVFASLNYRNAS